MAPKKKSEIATRLDQVAFGRPKVRRSVPFTERQRAGLHRMQLTAETMLVRVKEFREAMGDGDLTETECEDRFLMIMTLGEEVMKAVIHQMGRLHAVIELRARDA